jgi:hypothetical protein
MDPYTKAAAVWGRPDFSVVSTSCRAPYAGVSRVRFQGTLSTPFSGVPLAVTRKISGQVSTVNSAAPPRPPHPQRHGRGDDERQMPYPDSLPTDAYLASERLDFCFLGLVAKNSRQGRISFTGLANLHLRRIRMWIRIY